MQVEVRQGETVEMTLIRGERYTGHSDSRHRDGIGRERWGAGIR